MKSSADFHLDKTCVTSQNVESDDQHLFYCFFLFQNLGENGKLQKWQLKL